MKYTAEQVHALRQGNSIEECGMVLPLDDNHVRLKPLGRVQTAGGGSIGMSLAVVRCVDIRSGFIKSYCGLVGTHDDTEGLRYVMGHGQKTDDIDNLGAWIRGEDA